MAKALYRKYRSKSLAEVIGQKHVTDILDAALKQGRVSHAYLFTGPRGVGKTSVARILAHEINGLPYTDDDSNLDIIEIDAASNNGVDDIRSLREKVMIAPTKAQKKVYIIDEVHMLSKPAFNALLKTLEEPPEHVVFIMATTDTHKIPATIVSRSQKFSFRFISPEAVTAHLRHIADSEGIKITDDALALIAKKGGGSFRDSISLLDQMASVLSESEISKADVEQSLGLASDDMIVSLLDNYATGDNLAAIKSLQELLDTGTKPEVLAEQLIRHIVDDIDNRLEFLELLAQLPDVTKSSYPEIRLLTALTRPVTGAPTVKSSPSPATVAKTRPTPAQKPAEKAPEPTPAPAKPTKLGQPEAKLDPAPTETQPKEPAGKADEPKEEPKPKKSSASTPSDFSWDGLLEDLKDNRPAIYSVLSKCGHEINGDELKVYAKNKLWQKKLDAPEFRQKVSAHGGDGLEVTVLAKAMPSKDSAVNSIADIMGGGEEVDVE